MKFLLYIICLVLFLDVRGQVGYEDYYSERDLSLKIEHAKTLIEKIDAIGMLAQHYKGIHQDSLGDLYYKKIPALAGRSADDILVGRALWWDMRYHADTA